MNDRWDEFPGQRGEDLIPHPPLLPGVEESREDAAGPLGRSGQTRLLTTPLPRLRRGSPRSSVLSIQRSGAAWLIVGGLAGLWGLVVGRLAIAQHLALHTGNDLGVFAQTVWATAQGHPFYTSLTLETTNFLGHHFAPLLAGLAPLDSLWPDARLLLVVQTVALAVSAVPLFAFARPRLGPGFALLVVGAFLLAPPLHFIALFDFHEIALAVPLLMAAGAALLNRRPRATLLWLGLALLAKEEVALIAVGFGLYALLIQRRWRFGALLTAGALLWAAVLFGWLMPALNTLTDNYTFARRYETLGATPGEVLETLVRHPVTVVAVLARAPKGAFLWQLLAPLAGLPLVGLPAVLLGLPTLAYLLLSDYDLQASIRYHYTAPLLPFLFLATVVALQRLRARSLRLEQVGASALLFAALAGAWWWSPLPGARSYEPERFTVTEEARAARALMATVPPDVPVAADWPYLPWLANRWRIDTLLAPPFLLIDPTDPPDYLLTAEPGPGAVSAPVYPWIVLDKPGRPIRLPRFAPRQVTAGGVTLWKRRGHEHDVVLVRTDAPFERGLTLVGAGTPPEAPAWDSVVSVALDETLPIWMAWSAVAPLDRRVTFTLHLVTATGRTVAQVDQEMGAGRFPTTLWHTWMDHPVVVGEFPLLLAADLPVGRYRLLAGAYDSQSLAALARPDGSQWFELATVAVRP
ncbi:MAG: DUF2079 domain-containing protein [Ardenticatenaceae bacterium]|nr:DUF2079 domain-containing protein [Ardenticatenaceae bacterium]